MEYIYPFVYIKPNNSLDLLLFQVNDVYVILPNK